MGGQPGTDRERVVQQQQQQHETGGGRHMVDVDVVGVVLVVVQQAQENVGLASAQCCQSDHHSSAV